MMLSLTGQDTFSLRPVASICASDDSEISLTSLTTAMREGSDEAWQEFHRRYYISLLRYASIIGCFDEADEVVQKAYLRIARHIKPFAAENEFRQWLACVVRSTAIDRKRGLIRRAILMEKFALWRDAQNVSAIEPPTSEAHNSLANEALAILPTGDAELLRLKYYEGWSVDELARDANTSPKAIENRLGRLRNRLRAIVLRLR